MVYAGFFSKEVFYNWMQVVMSCHPPEKSPGGGGGGGFGAKGGRSNPLTPNLCTNK